METKVPKLSIIVPCYNYAHYLRNSVDSILRQNFSDYELLLTDDGSSDETWEILKQYGERHPQIRIFKNPANLGIFKTNLQGWNDARGEYLFFFSADDLVGPTCLSRVMELFQKNPRLGLVCADIDYFTATETRPNTRKLIENCAAPQVFTSSEMVPLFQKTPFWIPGGTCVVKAEILKKHGHLDPYLENISDWFCFHKIALLEGVGYIPESLISMRLHDKTYTSIVKRDKQRRRATYKYLLTLLAHHPDIARPFKQSGLLSFIFHEMGWKLSLNPRYLSYLRYVKKKR